MKRTYLLLVLILPLSFASCTSAPGRSIANDPCAEDYFAHELDENHYFQRYERCNN